MQVNVCAMTYYRSCINEMECELSTPHKAFAQTNQTRTCLDKQTTFTSHKLSIKQIAIMGQALMVRDD